MAILFMEGFDGHASKSEIYADPRIGVDITDSYYVLGTGRNGSGNSFGLTNSTSNSSFEFICNISSISDSTIWVQCAFNLASYPAASDRYIKIIKLWDGSTPQGHLEVDLAGNLHYYRGDRATLLGSSGSVISTSTWHYIELKVVLNGTTGTVDAYVDGVSAISLSSQDTIESSNTRVTSVSFGGPRDNDSQDILYDDIVIGDGSGTDATDLLGDCTIEYLYPDGAGNYAQWTPSAGSNYQNVDEGATHDSDTTYNSSSTAAQKDSFTCDNLTATSGTVHAVQVTTVSKKGAGGGRKLRGLVRESATDATGTGKYVPDSYMHRHDIFENNPSGSNWTVSTVNSMEIGYELET